MRNFKLHGREIISIFQLMGYSENDISHSTAWVLGNCVAMLKVFINDVCGVSSFNPDDVVICVQEFDKNSGITDIEIKDSNEFFIIVEAKRGWILPSKEQLRKYSNRESFIKSPAKNKMIVTLSECSRDYANHYLDIKSVNGFPIKHVSWKDIYEFSDLSFPYASNSEKKLLKDLQIYLRGLVTMQVQNSNEVYVVSLGSGNPDNCLLSWIEIVKQKNKYFHPMGKGWPKEPPNYIAFRYNGRLQSIHHIEGYLITINLHTEILEMPDQEGDTPHFIYDLGPAIIPAKVITTGNIYSSGRVWCHIDTLLTCDTISEARDLTKKRLG